MDISVIIVNYKTPEMTCKAIDSVFTHKNSLNVEIIVVDNNSGDGSVDILEKKCSEKITLIQNDKNVGFAKANNIAMKKAAGTYYLLLNSDAEFIDDTIEVMFNYIETKPEIGILGCAIISPDGSKQASCWKPPTLPHLLLRALFLYKIVPDGWFGSYNANKYGNPSETCYVDCVSGCVMMIPQRIANKVGLFDERFFMYSEDTEWCIRMKKFGYKIGFLSKAKVMHYGGGTSAKMLDKMTVERMRSILQLIFIESGMIKTYMANYLLMMFFIIRLPVWLMLIPFRSRKEEAKSMFEAYLKGALWHITWPFKEGLRSLK